MYEKAGMAGFTSNSHAIQHCLWFLWHGMTASEVLCEGLSLGSYRSRLDIIADILHVIDGGSTKKTQVMYQANLSYKLLKKYLAEVLRASLVRFDRRGKCYLITVKGQRFLEKYKKYSRWNKNIEKRLTELDNSKKALENLTSSK